MTAELQTQNGEQDMSQGSKNLSGIPRNQEQLTRLDRCGGRGLPTFCSSGCLYRNAASRTSASKNSMYVSVASPDSPPSVSGTWTFGKMASHAACEEGYLFRLEGCKLNVLRQLKSGLAGLPLRTSGKWNLEMASQGKESDVIWRRRSISFVDFAANLQNGARRQEGTLRRPSRHQQVITKSSAAAEGILLWRLVISLRLL